MQNLYMKKYTCHAEEALVYYSPLKADEIVLQMNHLGGRATPPPSSASV